MLAISKILPLPYDRFYGNPEYNCFRRAKLLTLNDLLFDYPAYSQQTESTKLQLLEDIEAAAYRETKVKALEYNIAINWTSKSFTDIYHTLVNKATSLFEHNDEVGAALLDKILQRELSCEDLIKCRISDLCKEQYQEILSNVVIRQNVQMTEKHSSLYRCPKCKKTECTIERMYSRSLDEGQNLKVTCTFCKYAWVA